MSWSMKEDTEDTEFSISISGYNVVGRSNNYKQQMQGPVEFPQLNTADSNWNTTTATTPQ